MPNKARKIKDKVKTDRASTSWIWMMDVYLYLVASYRTSIISRLAGRPDKPEPQVVHKAATTLVTY